MADQTTVVAPAVEPQNDFVAQLKGMTEAEFLGLEQKDPGIYAKIEALDHKSLNEIVEAQKANTLKAQQPPAPQGAPPASAPEPEEEVTVKLRRSELSTYAPKDRSTADSIREMIKGFPKKDETINYYKNVVVSDFQKKLDAATQENLSLKKALEKFEADEKARKAAQPAAAPTPEQPKPEDIKIPELPAELDFYNEDHQKLLSQTLAALTKANAAMMAKLSAPAAPAAPEQAPAQPQAAQQVANPSANDEFNEIRMLQANPEYASLLRTKTDIAQLDGEYVQFVEKVAGLAGIKNVYSATGDLTNEARAPLAAYFNPGDPSHEQVVKIAEAASVKPPEEIDKLFRIYTIREHRPVRSGTGRVVVPYETAATIAMAKRPDVFKVSDPVQNNLSLEQRRAAAVDSMSKKAREVPTGAGGELNDPNFILAEAAKVITSKPLTELLPAEKELVKAAMRIEGASEAEITARFPETT
jgi:hypothetical protein